MGLHVRFKAGTHPTLPEVDFGGLQGKLERCRQTEDASLVDTVAGLGNLAGPKGSEGAWD